MNEVDDAILEFLVALGEPGGERVVIAPKDVWLNLCELRGQIDKAPNTVSRRMSELEKRGLLTLVGNTGKHYRLTNLGVDYLNGDAEPQDLKKRSDD